MQTRHPGIILSGGRSTRMATPKALLPFGAGRLLDHVAARLAPQVASIGLNANDPAITLPGIPTFPDRVKGFAGPLAGIHAALAGLAEAGDPATGHAAFVTVDTPFVPSDLVARLSAALTRPDAVVLAESGGRLHPLTGLWPLETLRPLADWLADPPTLKARAFIDMLPTIRVSFPAIETPLGPIDPFFNVNTPHDLATARRLLECLDAESPDP
jgi:molybdopterin-guanine dinucleotide biosynthesis protein A